MARVPSRIGTRPPGAPAGKLPSRGAAISDSPVSPMWRRRLRRASFKGVPFYVEQQGRSSGRRTVVFEYPKRDIPYAEDMGRVAMRYQMTGYLIQAPVPGFYHDLDSDYDIARDRLEAVLLSPGAGRLVDPYNPRLQLSGYDNANPLDAQLLFMCERYTIIESRERGGFCSVEMSFVEAGIPGNTAPDTATAAAVQQIVTQMTAAAAQQLNQAQAQANAEE